MTKSILPIYLPKVPISIQKLHFFQIIVNNCCDLKACLSLALFTGEEFHAGKAVLTDLVVSGISP